MQSGTTTTGGALASRGRPERSLERLDGPRNAVTVRDLAAAWGVAAAAFAALSFAQGALVPKDALMEDRGRAREEIFRERPGAFDVAYFGSSRFEVGLEPQVVDACLAERGFALRSFNFALGGANSFEVDWLMRRVIGARDPRLRYVVVELPEWTIDRSFLNTVRTLSWHDWRATRGALAALPREASLFERTRMGAEHVKLLAMRTAAVGLGPSVVRDELDGHDGIAKAVAELAATAGFFVREQEDYYLRERERVVARASRGENEGVRARIDEYEGRLAALRAGEGPTFEIDPYPVALLREQRAFLEAHGVRCVYVVVPMPLRTPWAEELRRQGETPALFCFNDIERYPELLEIDVHFDGTHLTREGAQRFSRRFADEFAELLMADARDVR